LKLLFKTSVEKTFSQDSCNSCSWKQRTVSLTINLRVSLHLFLYLPFCTLVSGKKIFNSMNWTSRSDNAFGKGNITYDCILVLSTKILSITENDHFENLLGSPLCVSYCKHLIKEITLVCGYILINIKIKVSTDEYHCGWFVQRQNGRISQS